MKAKHLATMTGEQHEALLTQEDVGARLQVTVRTVVRLQNDGVLPFILLGKAVRFHWPTVISHLNANFTVVRCEPHGPLRATGNLATKNGGTP